MKSSVLLNVILNEQQLISRELQEKYVTNPYHVEPIDGYLPPEGWRLISRWWELESEK